MADSDKLRKDVESAGGTPTPMSQPSVTVRREPSVTGSAAAVRMNLKEFSPAIRQKLARFDNNNDGYIDASELHSMAAFLAAEKFRSKVFRNMLVLMTVFTVVLLGSLFGLTWAVVKSLKDTTIQGTLLTTEDGRPLLTADADLMVMDGRLVSRNDANNGSVLTATALTYAKFTPDAYLADFETLDKLEIMAKGSDAGMLLNVLSVSKSLDGATPLLHISTPLGRATMRGQDIELDADLSNIAASAGFAIASADGKSVLQGTTTLVSGAFTGQPKCTRNAAGECWLRAVSA